MNTRTVGRVMVILASLMVAATAEAAGNEKTDIGKREYLDKCAVCHGQSGKGDGGAIDVLKVAPADLTTLAKRNGGVFPFERVYAVIDGREVVRGHGSRDMPIWGKDYNEEGVAAANKYFDAPYDMEMYVRSRILALIDYLNRIQARQ